MDTCVCLLERDLLEGQLDDAGLFFCAVFSFLKFIKQPNEKKKNRSGHVGRLIGQCGLLFNSARYGFNIVMSADLK